jgi:nickel/cobalt transporter (NicO) family protein
MRRKMFLLLFVFCLVGFFMPQASPAQNPFFAPPASEQEQSRNIEERSKLLRSPALVKLNTLQRDFREKMTGYARQIQEAPTGATTISFLALTFLYGVVHALGPGHGKSIVGSYFLARRGTLKQALFFGNLITFMHVFSATVIVFGLALLGRKTNIFSFQEVEGGLQSFSYLFIFLIGVYLLVKAIWDICMKKRGGGDGADAKADAGSMAALSLSAGLIPCPGAALILLFTLSLDIQWAGLAAMIALGAGMGLTNSLVGVATMGSRGAVMRLTRTSPRLFTAFYSLFAVSGSLFITLLGLSLYLSRA